MEIRIDGVKYVPEVEEEKKESALYNILFDFCGDYQYELEKESKDQDWNGFRLNFKQQIIDLTKTIVDQKAGMTHTKLREFYLDILKALDEM